MATGPGGVIVDRNRDWIVPRRVMCGIFWVGVLLLFTGIILLVTSRHKLPTDDIDPRDKKKAQDQSEGQTYQAWGCILMGLGFCLLLSTMILCLHAYCVISVTEAPPEQNKRYVKPPLLPELNGHKPGEPVISLEPANKMLERSPSELGAQVMMMERDAMGRPINNKNRSTPSRSVTPGWSEDGMLLDGPMSRPTSRSSGTSGTASSPDKKFPNGPHYPGVDYMDKAPQKAEKSFVQDEGIYETSEPIYAETSTLTGFTGGGFGSGSPNGKLDTSPGSISTDSMLVFSKPPPTPATINRQMNNGYGPMGKPPMPPPVPPKRAHLLGGVEYPDRRGSDGMGPRRDVEFTLGPSRDIDMMGPNGKSEISGLHRNREIIGSPRDINILGPYKDVDSSEMLITQPGRNKGMVRPPIDINVLGPHKDIDMSEMLTTQPSRNKEIVRPLRDIDILSPHKDIDMSEMLYTQPGRNKGIVRPPIDIYRLGPHQDVDLSELKFTQPGRNKEIIRPPRNIDMLGPHTDVDMSEIKFTQPGTNRAIIRPPRNIDMFGQHNDVDMSEIKFTQPGTNRAIIRPPRNIDMLGPHKDVDMSEMKFTQPQRNREIVISPRDIDMVHPHKNIDMSEIRFTQQKSAYRPVHFENNSKPSSYVDDSEQHNFIYHRDFESSVFHDQESVI